MEHDLQLLAECLALAEKKAGWGDSRRWTNSDFEALQEAILAETGVSLSASTLKRLWGKVPYEGTPQKATLNALARFVGYPSYRDFQQAHRKADSLRPAGPAPTRQKDHAFLKRFASGSRIWTVGLVTGFVLALMLAFSLSRQPPANEATDPDLYAFSSRPVSTGIPNSVVFTFDVSQAKTDCLQIQQDWDEALRFTIARDQQLATSIYYYPGFYHAKLLVDGVTVREHDLHIQTEGWLPLVEQKPVPVYFTEDDGRKDGYFGLTAEQIGERNIPMQPVAPWVDYYYVGELGGVSGNSFALETRLKNLFAIGSGACQRSFVAIQTKHTVMMVPLSIPGCTSALQAYLAGHLLKGDEVDLSALGVDLSQWVDLRLEVVNKHITVFLNGQRVLESTFTADAGDVTGISFRFQGTGAVDFLRLYDGEGKMAFREEFGGMGGG